MRWLIWRTKRIRKMNEQITPDFRFDAAKHKYECLTPGGWKRLTGVSTIVGQKAKPQLIPWAAKMALVPLGFDRDGKVAERVAAAKKGKELIEGMTDRAFADFLKETCYPNHKAASGKAAKQGTDVHTEYEAVVKRWIAETSGLPVDCKYRDLTEWAVCHGVRFTGSEVRMMDRGRWFAGTADALAETHTWGLVVIDWKVTGAIWDTFWLTTAGYQHLAELSEGRKYDARVVVRLNPDGTIAETAVRDDRRDIDAFMACLDLYRWDGRIKSRVEQAIERRMR